MLPRDDAYENTYNEKHEMDETRGAGPPRAGDGPDHRSSAATAASQARRGPLRGGVAFLFINELVVRDRLLELADLLGPAGKTQPRRVIFLHPHTLGPVAAAGAVAALIRRAALEAAA